MKTNKKKKWWSIRFYPSKCADLSHPKMMTQNQHHISIKAVKVCGCFFGFFCFSQLYFFFSQTDFPDRHPKCTWAPAEDTSHVQFSCTWFGAYPTPMLRWGEDQGEQGARWRGRVFVTETTDSLSMTRNRSELHKGQTLRCMAQHMALVPEKEKSCSLTLSKHAAVKRAS